MPIQVLVPAVAFPLARVHADVRRGAERRPEDAEHRVPVECEAVDVRLPPSHGGEEGQEQGEGAVFRFIVRGHP